MLNKKYSVLVLLLFIFLKLDSNLVSGCEFFETKRTCECTAMYSIGQNTTVLKILFKTASYDDCGVNLGCEKYDCATNCLNSIRRLVGGRPDFITDQGKNSLCGMVAPSPNDVISVPGGIGLWASWKYSSCRSGLVLIQQDVCCNRKCNCNLANQDVKVGNSATKLNVIRSFPIVYPQQAYECTLKESDECHSVCMEKISNYFDDPSLSQPDESQFNLNVIANNVTKSNRVCLDLNKTVNKPGTDVYVQSSAGSNMGVRYKNLGRVCCASPCKCDYIFQYAETNVATDKSPFTVPIVDDLDWNLGYECSNELSDCMAYCRRIAFIKLEIDDANYVKKDTTQRTDVFRSIPSLYSQYICSLIEDTLNGDFGFNVYLRYSVSGQTPTEFPYREDIHIGRLCCRYIFGNWLPTNRCTQVPYPPDYKSII